MEQKDFKKLFWSKVNILGPDDCWPWQACLDKKGYGKWSTGPSYGVSTKSHRVSWQLIKGSIPSGMYVCHSCDNPRCCNPTHLFLGTDGDNTADMMKKRRFTWGKVPEGEISRIRRDERSHREIAKEYGVHHSTIGRIKRADTWGDWFNV